ncbi:hypothetical protein B7463_g7707, partial [Scytalidium lignicola]
MFFATIFSRVGLMFLLTSLLSYVWDFVRYSPNRLAVNTATGLHDIYTHEKNVKKSKGYNAMVHRSHNTLTMFDKKEHGRRRRLISQGFSDAALRQYQGAIMTHVMKFCSCLCQNDSSKADSKGSEWSSPKNMARWNNYLAFDIMADVILGQKYNLLDDSSNRFVVEAIENSNVRVGVLIQAPEISIFRLDKWLFRDAIKARNLFIKFVNRFLRERMSQSGSGTKDVFSILITAKDPQTGEGFRLAEIGSESTTLMVAGSDTSSTTLAGLFFYLTRYPEVYAKVTEEVRMTFSSVDEISLGSKLTSCTYLRACIDEVLRLSPPVGSALWREVRPGGAVVDGHFIPAGCDVGTPIYSIHHNASYYPDPFTFLPERWLGDGAKLAQSAYTPFSLGPRGCIGKGFALVELQLAMATVLWKLDFRVAPGPDGRAGEGTSSSASPWRRREKELQLYDHITGAKRGPLLQFRERTAA